MLHTALMIIHFFSAASIIALVLLQRGKGADAGAGFGAGASGTVFGARGAGTALSRATAILAGIFMITSLSLTYVGAHTKVAPNTVLDQMSQHAPAPIGPAGSASPTTAPAPATNGQAPVGVAPSSVAPAATPAPTVPAPANGTPADPAH